MLVLGVYKMFDNQKGIRKLAVQICFHIFVIIIGQSPSEATCMESHRQKVADPGGQTPVQSSMQTTVGEPKAMDPQAG